MARFHLRPLPKKTLGRHGKKLSRVRRPVLIQQGRQPGIGRLGQRLIFPTQNPRPGLIHRGPRERRRARRDSLFLIELMSELVKHNASGAPRIRWPPQNMIPRDHNRPARPGFTGSRFVRAHHKTPNSSERLGNQVGVRINQDRSKPRIIIVTLDMQQQDARISGYRDLDLVSHLQPPAPLKILFADEDLNRPLQFPLLGRQKLLKIRNISPKNFQPRFGKGLRGKAIPSACFKSKHCSVNITDKPDGRRDSTAGTNRSRPRLSDPSLQFRRYTESQ
jgi:hypothetical protein